MTTLTKLALAIPLAVAVSACGSYGKTPEERALARADSILDDIDATDDQRAQVRAAVTDLTKTLAEQRVVRGTTKGALLAQLEAKRADASVVDAEAAKLTAAFATSAHAAVDAGARIHDALTPEQRQRLTEKMKPGRPMKAAFFLAGRMGYGPPADADEAKARAAKRLEKGLDAIDATDDQKQALRPIAEALVDDALPLLDDRDEIVNAVTGAWASANPDVKALHALVDAQAAKVDVVTRSAARSFVEAHAILTPEQRTTLATRISDGGCDG